MASGNNVSKTSTVEMDTATLRYHLTSLYALRPTPDDMVRLIEQIDARRRRGGGRER